MIQEEITEVSEIVDGGGVVQETSLAELDTTKLSQQERFVRNVLKDFEVTETYTNPHTGEEKTITTKADPESIIKQVFEESNKVVTQNARGDIIPDYKARAQLKIKLLESMGVIKPKQPEIKINFLSLLFGKN